MLPDLSDRTAVVTGAGRGIGRSVALELAERGARVVLAARTRSEVDAVAAEIAAAGGRAAIAFTVDVTKEEEVAALFTRVKDACGRLDILINNAGTGRFGELVAFSVAEFDRIFAVNVRGAFLCLQGAMKLMIPAGRGTIINISSVVGFRGYPKQSAYAASKHALMGLTKALAVEAQAHGIRVSAVLPGGVDTGLIGDARPDLDRSQLLAPEDIAQAILYLLSLPERAAVDEIYIRRRASAPF